jgi:transposase-like protein
MKTNVKRFPDELAYQIVQEYLTTNISQSELKKKYNFGGNGNIYRWMRKFGVSKLETEQLNLNRVMSQEKESNPRERELELKISKLEYELQREKFKALALNTLIDVAESDLNIEIRKKPGAKR